MRDTIAIGSRAAFELPNVEPLVNAAHAYFDTPARRHLKRVAGLQPEERARAIERVGSLDVTTARVIHCVLSRVLGDSQQNERQQAAKAVNLLKQAGALEWINEYTHEAEPPSHPELLLLGCPSGSAALNSLGLKGPDLGKYWAESHVSVEDRCLPLQWVLEFVPAPFWPLIATAIGWGPYELRERIKRVFSQLASTPLPPTRRRQDAPGTAIESMLHDAAQLWRLLDGMVKLRSELHLKEEKRESEVARRRASSESAELPPLALDPKVLKGWVAKPDRLTPAELRALGATEARSDTSAPPPEDVKRRLKELARDAHAHLGAEEIRRRRKETALLKLVEFALMALYGLRPGAAAALNVEHYKPDYPLENGRGPALIIHVESLTETGAILDLEFPRFRGHLSAEPVLSGLAGRIAHHVHDVVSQAVSAGVPA